MKSFISLRQASRELGVTMEVLKAFLEQAEVRVLRGKKRWYIPRAAIDRLKQGLLRSGEEAR